MIIMPYSGELYVTMPKHYITIQNNLQQSLWLLDNKFQF